MWLWTLIFTVALTVVSSQVKPPSFFVNEIFEKYGDRNVLTYEVSVSRYNGGNWIWVAVNGTFIPSIHCEMGRKLQDARVERYIGTQTNGMLGNFNIRTMTSIYDSLGRVNFDETHDISLHKINGTFLDIHDKEALHRHPHKENRTVGTKEDNRNKRHVISYSSEQGNNSSLLCLSPGEILESYGLSWTHGLIISHDNFKHLCPAIIYELDQKHCWKVERHEEETERSRLQVWVEASLSILIMSIAGLLCAAIIPVLHCNKGGELLQFLVSIAAGTLVGDALIHLLPQALNYDSNDHDTNTPLLRATVVLMSIILFYIIEGFLRIIQRKKQSKLIESPEEHKMMDHGHTHNHAGQRPLACVVIAGDILHNVTDGLSVGAAFSASRSAGIACATAVFCHELPHELGDYAVLLREGMGVRKALLCNIFSSVFSFGGMTLGLLLAEVLYATPWVNAFTAGSFIYIALADLVPEMKSNCSIGSLLCQVIGLTSGVVIMFFIGLYEHQWENFLTS